MPDPSIEMKYAHYLAFYDPTKDPKVFAAFISDVQNIVENAPNDSQLCGKEPDQPPVINNEMLIIGSSANPSPFSKLSLIQHKPTPQHRYPMVIVRTDLLTYDSVICACLLAFVHHFPNSEVTSDGSREQWTNAIALYEYVTERKAPDIHLR